MSEENVEIVRALYEAFARRDGESPFSVYAPDIEWDMSRSAIPLPGEEAVYHGHEGVRRYARVWLEAWGFVDAPLERLVDAGDEVVALLWPDDRSKSLSTGASQPRWMAIRGRVPPGSPQASWPGDSP